ncbi:Phosphoribosylglycinamide formyltransferase [Rubripirellula lacrimiformis]|uniref:phosphoribosylglycinamide formyltransferase 1 n=1 Tax=Rubripirellula lacrimiformis TaxID=1930273 RepID=A0A517NEY4_9BACT|nr:phosphoribosylglycinamide formyltransferase [Rubripirellula lacrimiformis]QDT05694.1 Phosphoribosylglycinamide formyltransferase [Rubripirellula lacrimiformis]
MTPAPANLPIAVFLSGGGRTLENLIQHRDQHGLPIDIRLVISSSSKVRGVEVARSAGIDTKVVRKSEHPDEQDYCRSMFQPCRDAGAQYVVMAGFLKHVLIPDDFTNRVINIHPSLLPAFGGEGMYGGRVHSAAIDRGVQISGCTVHYVDNQYDNGPIILQRSCDVKPSDTPDSLASRVFEVECAALPDAIRLIHQSRMAT